MTMPRLHSQILGPRDWETTMHQNVVLTIFHTQNIYVTIMENSHNYIAMYYWSQIAGRRSWKVEQLWDKSVPYLSYLSKPSPRDWRTKKPQSVVLRVFHAWWHTSCVWKIVRTTFWPIVVSQSRGDCSRM